uniref:Integrase catalytic domain-containing protein n=1 Tax=Panagrellus redivivus TaxID=6233 RepID=A0A7E4ZZU5_PANRE
SWPFHDLTGIKPDIGLCKKRLENVQTTMQKQGILDKYDSIINEQQQSGLILEFDPETDPGYHYLPHHAVVNPDKETTKVRGVFDASAKTKDGKSLNDCILSGKPPVNSLAEITLYARCANIVVSSDVQSAFLTVNLSEDSQRYCCFLWLHDPSKPPTRDNLKHLRWIRMPFGVNASPLLLQLVIEKQLDEWSLDHPEDAEIAKEIKTKIYVDNVIQCANSPEEAVEKATKAKRIFEDCKMNLRKFRSSDANVDSKLDGKFAESKLLGIKWTPDDRFEIGWTKDAARPPTTKRQLLSFAAKPFDPAQLLSPATLPLKMLIQQLWIEKKSWNHLFDQKMQESVDALWIERAGTGISFPRKLFTFKPQSTYELQLFADSSGKAYGMAAYILQRNSSQIDTALIFAKSRLAPLKPVLTIPRLELTAAALAASTIPFLLQALPFSIDKTSIFTDSTTVLHWTKKEPESDRFVTNRIKKLREVNAEYRYVPTKQNPADIASRGCSPSDLMKSDLWWKGPRFLHDDPATWPQIPATSSDTPIASIASQATVIVQHKSDPTIDPSTFSSWLKLLRVTMKIADFRKNAAKSINKDTGSNLTSRKMAENWIIRQIQQQITLTDKRINELALFKDANGIWRQHSRLQQASELSDETKNPILLGHTTETELLILDIHRRLGHASESMILAELRQRFTLPQGRKIIRNTLRRRCLDCRRRKARPFKLPVMPDLPQSRISMAEVFQHVGIDYAGPFTVKLQTDDINKTLKCYICLLTCMSTRAIHLEVVYSASTASFVQALRRFIARRGGPPKTITSDNGSQFKAAASIPELRTFEKDREVADFSTNEGIQWIFITERAPWKGGFYERLIGLTKTALKAAIGRTRPTFEEFSTYVTEAEVKVNKRPLTPVSADNSEQIISPASF